MLAFRSGYLGGTELVVHRFRSIEERHRRISTAPAAVGAYIGAAYFFTSSTSFANPAISVGRMFSNTFAGIAPASVPGFVLAQLVGGAAAILAIRTLYPNVTPADAAEVVIAHVEDETRADGAVSQPVSRETR